MSELLGLIGTAIFGFIAWYLDRKKNKIRTNLEIQNLTLENEKLILEKESLLKEKTETEIKLNFLNRIMDLEFINAISEAVNRIFEETVGDRFLILVAKNGKDNFNVVSVVFEAHKKKEYRINAIARYRNVKIDEEYRKMLKEAEFKGVIHLKTENMAESVLKDFYEMEGITHSKIRHLARKPIDDNNDFLIYSSISTHENRDFSKRGLAFIKTQFEGVIFPSITEILD